MRENQVFATGMQIEALSQILHRHYRALNVPARATRADGAFPKSLARLRRFPQSEVAGIVFLILVHVYPGADFDAAEILLGKFAILGKFGDGEIIRAVVSAVRKV